MSDEDCPECGSSKLFQDGKHGELVCDECGFVVAENFTDRRPPRNGDEEENNLHHTGLPTSTLNQGEGKGATFSYKESDNGSKGKFRRMQNYDKRSKQKDDEPSTMQEVRVEVKRLSGILTLPKYIQKRATNLYKELSEQGSIRGRGMNVMITGCIYTACREHSMLRTIEEISEICSVRKAKILDAYKKMQRELDIQEGHVKCTEYVKKFCNEFDLTPQERKRARTIIERVRDDLTGKNPKGIVGSSIYISALESESEHRFSQRHVANVVGVTDVTIRNRFREITNILDIKRDKLLN